MLKNWKEYAVTGAVAFLSVATISWMLKTWFPEWRNYIADKTGI